MPYIGNPPAERYSKLAKQDVTGDGTVGPYTLDYAVGSVAEIEVFVNNVRQEPTEAYTVAGDQLTMTGTVASTDDFYVVFQGKAIASGQVPEKQSDGSYVYLGDVDINGNDLILDADADTKLYASTDDVVKMNIAGSEVFRFDADGLKFNGDTAAANALDDYEEGTWTPTVSNGTISADYANYTKIGNTVHLRCQLSSFSDRSTASGITIGGLPYTSASNNRASQGILGRYVNSGGDAIIAYISQSSSELIFFTTNQTSDYVRVNHNHLSSNSSNFFITISYIA
jgi:hypothetical protein